MDKMVKISVGMLDFPWLWRRLEPKTAAPAGVVTLLKASAMQSELQPYRSGGNPRSVLGSDVGGALRRYPSWATSGSWTSLGRPVDDGGVRAGGAAFHLPRQRRRFPTAWCSGGSTTDAFCLDERRVVALSVVVAATIADLARVLVTIYTPEMGSRKIMVATSGG